MTTQREPLDLTQFAGHTPGPWRVITPKDYAEPDDDPDYIGTTILAIVGGENDATVVSTDSGRVNQHAGNMRLIAAAPDLLAEVTRLRAVNARLRDELENAKTNLAIIADISSCAPNDDEAAAGREFTRIMRRARVGRDAITLALRP